MVMLLNIFNVHLHLGVFFLPICIHSQLSVLIPVSDLDFGVIIFKFNQSITNIFHKHILSQRVSTSASSFYIILSKRTKAV